MITLTMANADDFVTSVVLDDENYRLHLSWNNTGFWTMDIRDDKNVDIVRGIKLVPNFPLLNQYRRFLS